MRLQNNLFICTRMTLDTFRDDDWDKNLAIIFVLMWYALCIIYMFMLDLIALPIELLSCIYFD